jgi:hypothetical protein
MVNNSSWWIVEAPGGGPSVLAFFAEGQGEAEADIAVASGRSRTTASSRRRARARARKRKASQGELGSTRQVQRDQSRGAAAGGPISKARRAPITGTEKPGRAPGHKGARRAKPILVDKTVEAPLRRCPQCGGQVNDVRQIVQTVEDVPAVRPVVTEIVTYAGRCRHCGPVRSSHPMRVSTACGAAGVQIGARAAALATNLNKRLGIPAAKTCAVLKEHLGLRLTPGGLMQLQSRIAHRLEPVLSRNSSGRDFRTICGARTDWKSVRSAGILRARRCSQ